MFQSTSRLLIILSLLTCVRTSIAAATAEPAHLQPFRSDGCSLFPNGTFAQQALWLRCCQAHDLAYWQGGDYQARLQADRDLQHCVATVGEPKIAKLMLAGVRVGGSPYLPTPFRWGYGWPYPRGYQPLTEPELKQVNQLQRQSPLAQQLQVVAN